MKFVKYPKTFHLPWSEGITSDDKVMPSICGFVDREVVVTEKMDGENTTLYSDHIHARSLDSKHHPSRSWVKQFWQQRRSDIPDSLRICGENLYARHSISYVGLKSYFMGFSIWNDRDICLSWDQTLEWFELIGIEPVPVLYRGTFDEEKIKGLWSRSLHNIVEGYVIRVADKFPASSFVNVVGKFVRPNHVQTDKHWMMKEITVNLLGSDRQL